MCVCMHHVRPASVHSFHHVHTFIHITHATRTCVQAESVEKAGKVRTLQEDLHLLIREKDELRARADGLATKLVRGSCVLCSLKHSV